MARTNKPKYLTQKRRRWYAVLDIPKDVRGQFSGKPRFTKSLKTESLSEAEILVLPIITEWKLLIQAARSTDFKPYQELSLAKEWGKEIRTMEGNERENALSLVAEKATSIAFRDEDDAQNFYEIATGLTTPTIDCLEQWLATTDNAPKSIDMKRTDVKRFAQRFPMTNQVTKQGVRKWAHDLQYLDGLSPTTVRRIISACRGYWLYLERTGEIPPSDDVFSNAVARKSKSKASQQPVRKPFSTNDVIKLLEAAGRIDQPLAQLIWLSMWTGCRIEEICYLKKVDVLSDRFNVADAKTDAGRRTIPIHSRLNELMTYLVNNGSDEFVLSDLTFNKYGQRSNAIGKKFGRLKSKLGYGKNYVFHSIRKTVATELENAFVPETVTADLLGHEKKTMSYGLYSGGTHFGTMVTELEKLTYPLSGTPDYLFNTP